MTAEAVDTDILHVAREQVLERGERLTYDQIVQVLQTSDDQLDELLAIAHEVRMRFMGPEVEVEGIVSRSRPAAAPRTATSARSRGSSPPGALGLAQHPRVGPRGQVETATRAPASSASSPPCAGPTPSSWSRCARPSPRSATAVDINVAASLGILTREQVADLADMGIHRYNHNLEAGRSYFPQVVTTHSWEERWDTCQLIKVSGMELCCGGLVGMGESIEQRAELAGQLGELEPHEVPLNFLNPRPGTPFGDLPVMPANDALRTIAAFRLACPARSFATPVGRELTLGDLGTRRAARRHQRRHRRQLPHDAGPRPQGRPRAAR
jgi:biotin synthase